jgi:hypothetical protein
MTEATSGAAVLERRRTGGGRAFDEGREIADAATGPS